MRSGFYLDRSGFTTLEVLIALFVFTLSVSAVLLISFDAQDAVLDSGLKTQGLFLLQNSLRTIEYQARNNFSSAVSTSSSINSLYYLKITITQPDSVSKLIDATISWNTSLGKPQSLDLQKTIVNFSTVAEGNYCSQPANLSLWKTPTILGKISIAVGTSSQNKATGLDVRQGIAYLAANSSSIHDSDLFIIDVHNPAAPLLISQLDTGPGLSALVVHGNYAYVANQSLSNQLQIIDISSPQNPRLVAQLTLPGIIGTGASGIGNSIFYADNKIYIGTTKANGPEFHIIDVSDPLHPHWLGSFEIGAAVNSIAVLDTYVYVATPNAQEVTILDAADPTHIILVGTFDAPLGSGNGKSIVSDGDNIFLGRTVGGKELYLLQAASSGMVSQLGVADINSSVDGMVARPPLLFLATTDSAKQFQAIDISSSTKPAPLSFLSLAGRATAIDCYLDQVYVTTDATDTLMIIGPHV